MNQSLFRKTGAFRYVSTLLNFKLFLLVLAFFAIGSHVKGQGNTFDGTWIASTEMYHSSEPVLEFTIDSKANTILINSIQNQAADLGSVVYNISTSLTTFSWNRLNTDLDTAMNHTRNLSILSIGNPFYHYGHITFADNVYNADNASMDCFLNGSCNLSTGEVIVRPKPLRIIEEDQLFVGGSSQTMIEIEEVRFTEKSIEILLLFTTEDTSYTGSIHKPGADFAFFLRDAKGNKYNLLGQMGWEGNDEDKFGSYTIPEETEHHVVLYFEPVNNPQTTSNLNLLEGECEEGCWNFYDIRLKDN